jgi:hypothetical protein
MKELYFIGRKGVFVKQYKPQGISNPVEKHLEQKAKMEGAGLKHSEEFKVTRKNHEEKVTKKPKFLSLKL